MACTDVDPGRLKWSGGGAVVGATSSFRTLVASLDVSIVQTEDIASAWDLHSLSSHYLTENQRTCQGHTPSHEPLEHIRSCIISKDAVCVLPIRS